MFKKLFLLFLSLSASVFAQSISLEASKWYLLGTPSDINISSMNLNDGDIIWNYTDSSWQYHKQGYSLTLPFEKITTLKAGEGFWIKPAQDLNLTLQDTNTISPQRNSGWNLLSPTSSDLNLTQVYTSSQTPYAWRYENGTWKLWSKDGSKEFENVAMHQGYWLYDASASINVGTKFTTLRNGVFDSVTHLATSTVEDIWNISFKVTTQDISSFNIGIKFVKSNGAYGEFIYYGLSLQNGNLTNPTALYIKGQKSDGSSATNSYDANYDPDNLRVQSISLVGNVLTLKLGTIMKNQTLVPATTFKAVSDYNITIVPEDLQIVGGTNKTLQNIAGFLNTFTGVGFSGDIKIH